MLSFRALTEVLFLAFCFSSISKVRPQSSWTITTSLAPNGKYNLTRWVNMDESLISFEVRVETTGFVGFGLSYTGDMAGADIVIGGVRDDDTIYFSDRHAVGRSEPIIDNSKDWSLLYADETDGITTLRFFRMFNTCDKDDIAITEDTLKIIWAYGASDTVAYHNANRGILSVNLLDPPQPSPDLSGLQEWPVTIADVMPAQETAYWCSIHTTAPEMTQKTYLVGFEALLDGEDAVTHTHHFIFSKCVVPDETARDILERRLGQPGQDCQSSEPDNPRKYCNMYMFVWAKGGERTMFPLDVGFPVVETPGQKEYYMLEIHYDNPKNISGMQFNTGINIFYDDKRTIEAGLLVIGHEVWFPHTIPPNSQNFMTLGHCPSVCTEWGFPTGGINVFNVLLHSHLSGRRLKVRHIRDGQELPWTAVDDNYDFNYQQNRPLRKELVVLPGDHLIYECITDTTWKKGNVTIGDLSTSDEMCEAFIFYYPKMNMDNCLTSVDAWELFSLVGIKNVTNNPENGNNLIITDPESMAGKTYIEALETLVDWTPELRSEFQQLVRFSNHSYRCGKGGHDPDQYIYGVMSYPDIEKEYLPENPCANEEVSTTEVSKTTDEPTTTPKDNSGGQMWTVEMLLVTFCLISVIIHMS